MKTLKIFFIITVLNLISGTLFAQPDTAQLLEKMDLVLRGESHKMTVLLDVKTASWERHYKLLVWMKGVDHTFARVIEPAKVEGQGFLRKKVKLWQYLPTAERTILIPPSMLLDRFMGSDFSNDDFVKMSYLPRDYDSKIISEENLENQQAYLLELTPRRDAPVTYGKLKVWLRTLDSAPLKIEFYNEKLVHIRTLHYSGFKNFGHEVPTLWRMVNHKEQNRQTTVTILEAEYGISIPDPVFSQENLEKYP